MDDLVIGLADAKPYPPDYQINARITADDRPRCSWGATTLDYAVYHDTEWGRATDDERTLFEKMCLEGFQSGLSWLTILRKRPAFRVAFADFDATAVAEYGPDDVERLLTDASIIRHRGKIEATINNAQALMAMRQRGDSLPELIWAHEPSRPQAPKSFADVSAFTEASTALSKALKKQGFRFVGPTTAYAAMQAMGVVNDHLQQCWVRDDCESSRKVLKRH